MEHEYLNNVRADNRLIGLEVLLNPFISHASPIRGEMFTRQSNQILVTDYNEFPYCFSGYETQIGDYQIDSSERNQDMTIVSIIPKFHVNLGGSSYGNPLTTVIGIGEDNKLCHFNISNYTMVSHGFGFFNVHKNKHYLKPGLLPKDVKLSVSPAYNDGAYSLGVNARVMITNDEHTTEDTFGISQEYADKCCARSIRSTDIFISGNQHPINLYGDMSEFKMFPDIGEQVNDDGILCALRTPTADSFIPDLMSPSLCKPNMLHDKVYRVPTGSIVLDVDVWLNNNVRVSLYLYNQLMRYQEIIKHYYQGIVDVYEQYKDKYEPSHEFNTLVTRCMEMLISMGETKGLKSVKGTPRVKLISKNRTIDVAKITITYTHPIKVAAGHKLAINMGGKGVCKIIPTEDMPVDDYGHRADILINMLSINNRMIPGTLYECFYTNIAETIKERIQRKEIKKPFEYIMEFLSMINPNYADVLRNKYNTPEKQKEYVQYCVDNFIYINVPPFLNTVSVKQCEEIYKKFGAPATPVTFYTRDKVGNRHKHRTASACFMGFVYTYTLCKIPDPKAPGAAYINQHHVPMKIKNKSKKSNGGVSRTPIKFGEAENRFLLAGVEDPDTVHRLFGLHALSPLEATGMVEEIMQADDPFCVPQFSISTDEIKRLNVMRNTIHSLFSLCGIETRDITIKDHEIQEVIEDGYLSPGTIDYYFKQE